MKRMILALMLGFSLIVPAVASAEVSDPLLQKLVDKGTLSPGEAEDIQSKKVELPAALKGLSLSGVFFFDYSFGKSGGTTATQAGSSAPTNYNRFTLQRAYLNVNKEVNSWLKVRVTPDIVTSATTTGNYTLRIKYAYADFLTPDLGPLTNIDIRAGVGHTPFLDFEDGLQGTRMQGPQFQDKRGVITSSDLGVSALGNLGGKLTKEQIADVGNSNYVGRYGSYHIGAYNGGGYSNATENNTNKAVEGRLTVRPLPDILPGLQLTYFGVIGKGNTANAGVLSPQEWTNNTGFLSFQHRYGVVSAEYFTGKGSFTGDTSTPKRKDGYSFFGKITAPMYDKVSLFGRYDVFDPNKDVRKDRLKTVIAGASYKIYGENYLVAAFEKTSYEHDDTRDKIRPQDDKKGQIVLQAAF
ncbi:hypothetical protein EPN18_06775 [bacterium]|nr:MAG: hypothetical protein EPN18_06775 [bacterium]